MATRHAMWLHGNAFVPEVLSDRLDEVSLPWEGPAASLTDSNIVGFRRGWGVTFTMIMPRNPEQDTLNWFHAAMPTPVLIDEARTRLDRIFVFFKAHRGVAVQHIHVWDGPFQMARFDNLHISGDHSLGIANENTFVISEGLLEGQTKAVDWGIGISVGVDRRTAEGSPSPIDREILFTTVGADFLKP